MKTKKTSLTYIDLFAGAGGLSEGFIKQGFTPIAHIEMDKDACYTLKTRLAYHYLKNNNKFEKYVDYLKQKVTRDELYEQVPGDILNTVINKEISGKTLKEIFNDIDEYINTNNINEVDIIIGGPPCQAYSLASRSNDVNENERRSRLKMLYIHYGRFLTKYKPKLFVFENVPGLYTSEDGKYYSNMKKYFKRIGYNMDDKEIDAADYGVIQRRKRLIIIGWRKDVVFSYPEFGEIKNKWSVKNIFYDLPVLKAGESKHITNYSVSYINSYLKLFEIRNGVNIVTQNISRPHNKKDLKIYKLAIQKSEKGQNIKNNSIPTKIRTQNNVISFLDRFKVVRKKTLSHTMIAHIAKDGHHYIHPDINQLRSITVREAARIQSFPDDYYFEGSRTSIFKQIGNAVPPILAKVFAKSILIELEK
ncbi:MAG: DNA cytosine methyltransferase [Ignavibacteria bacterium]